MKNTDLDFYLCAACGGRLQLQEGFAPDGTGNVMEGTIGCSSCGAKRSIIRGIPRFVEPENYASSFGYQWNIHRKTQLDSHTGMPISRHRLFSGSGWPERLDGQRLLEAGSGAGRFTEVLLQTGADVFSFDYSSAVEANFSNHHDQPNLHLFQGDIFNIPLPKKTFDKVVCLGVLQHTPDPEMAFKSLAGFVKPGGELFIDVYRASLPAYLQWKYVLRPLTKLMTKETLYKVVSLTTPPLIGPSAISRKLFGRAGARIFPIVEYSHLGLPARLNKEWAVLDTFDMYSPAHDYPQTLAAVRGWFESDGFTDVDVKRGQNGIIGKGKMPAGAASRTF